MNIFYQRLYSIYIKISLIFSIGLETLAFWMGLTNKYSKGKFIWTDGNPVVYTDFDMQRRSK